MASSSDDSMMNATLVSDLPPPAMSMMNDNNSKQPIPSSYQDLIKNMDIKQMQSQNQMQQMPQMTQQMPQMQLPQNQMQMPQNQMQLPPPESAMEMLHVQNSTYPGAMPQSAPIGDFHQAPSMGISQGPVVNSLLPDPMFFNPPPVERKKRRQSVEPAPMPAPVNTASFPAMDLNKIKPAILVASIVFALLSWGAPAIAKRLAWTVDAMTGKFTPSGLIVISVLTGGIYLGISEIIRKFGNGI